MLSSAQRALAAVAIVATQVASGPAVARHVDREQLMNDLRALADPALEGRGTGTAGGVKARDWLDKQFAAIGLAPAGSAGYQQPFASSSSRDATNVLGRIAGTEPARRVIVVSAHYDHLGVRHGRTYPGADDNASGVAALLAVARHLAAHPPRHPMMIAAFDAEEIGLRGARALVGSALLTVPSIALNINLDMVSRNDDNEIVAAGTYHTPSLRPVLEDVQRRSAVTIVFGHDRPAAPTRSRDDWTMLSDHGVFHRAGVPFVYFGVVDHADYHRPSDTVGKIDPTFFGNVADMIVEAVVTLDRSIP